MEPEIKRTRGRKPITDELKRAATCSITLTGSQRNHLEKLALDLGTTPSKLIIKRFKLK